MIVKFTLLAEIPATGQPEELVTKARLELEVLMHTAFKKQAILITEDSDTAPVIIPS